MAEFETVCDKGKLSGLLYAIILNFIWAQRLYFSFF